MGLPVQLNFYSNADVSIIDLMNTEDANFIGKHQVTLTNYDNTSLPAIAAGSIVENNGCLVKFTTECAIDGSPSDGTVYILLIPSGDPALGTATVTPTFSNTAPTWSDSKQGWYGTGGSANYRYIFILNKLSSSYYGKRPINNRIMERVFLISFASGDSNKTTNHDITDAETNNRILSITWVAYKSGVLAPSFSIDSSIYALSNVYFSDTTIYTDRSATGAAIDFYITVRYF